MISWKVNRAKFLITEKKTRFILGLDLKRRLETSIMQWSAPIEWYTFVVLLCEQSNKRKTKIINKIKHLFVRPCKSKIHVISSKFDSLLCPIQKRRRIPIHIQNNVQVEIKKLLDEGHIQKLDKCSSDCFIAPIVIMVKKYDSKKIGFTLESNK